MKVAPGIHRIGDHSIVNAYLLEDAGEVTIIDAGVPGYYRDIPRELAAMGRTVADVRALLLPMGTPTISALRSGSAANTTSQCRCMRPTLPWPAVSTQPGQGVRPDQARPVAGVPVVHAPVGWAAGSEAAGGGDVRRWSDP